MSDFQFARDEWDNRLGRLSTAARNWRLTSLLLLTLNLLLTAAVVYFGARSKYVPYLVQVDKLGQAYPLGLAGELAEPSLAVYRTSLSKLVQNVRSVYTDPGAQTQAALEAYAFLTGEARARVSAHLTEANPFKIAKDYSVSVQVNSVLKLGPSLWQVQWTETKRPIGAGATTTPSEWRAVLTTTHTTPRELDQIARNPTGILVTTIDWSRILTNP